MHTVATTRVADSISGICFYQGSGILNLKESLRLDSKLTPTTEATIHFSRLVPLNNMPHSNRHFTSITIPNDRVQYFVIVLIIRRVFARPSRKSLKHQI